MVLDVITEITKDNVMEVLTDKSVYAIEKDWFNPDKLYMKPISEVEVGKVLSNDTMVVRITE